MKLIFFQLIGLSTLLMACGSNSGNAGDSAAATNNNPTEASQESSAQLSEPIPGAYREASPGQPWVDHNLGYGLLKSFPNGTTYMGNDYEAGATLLIFTQQPIECSLSDAQAPGTRLIYVFEPGASQSTSALFTHYYNSPDFSGANSIVATLSDVNSNSAIGEMEYITPNEEFSGAFEVVACPED